MILSENAHTGDHLATFPNTEKRLESVKHCGEVLSSRSFLIFSPSKLKIKKKQTNKIVKPMLDQISRNVQEQNVMFSLNLESLSTRKFPFNLSTLFINVFFSGAENTNKKTPE